MTMRRPPWRHNTAQSLDLQMPQGRCRGQQLNLFLETEKISKHRSFGRIKRGFGQRVLPRSWQTILDICRGVASRILSFRKKVISRTPQ